MCGFMLVNGMLLLLLVLTSGGGSGNKRAPTPSGLFLRENESSQTRQQQLAKLNIIA